MHLLFVCLAGVVDEDYRGVLKVILFNHSDKDFEVKRGDRIAQLICEKIYYPEIEEVQVNFIEKKAVISSNSANIVTGTDGN